MTADNKAYPASNCGFTPGETGGKCSENGDCTEAESCCSTFKKSTGATATTTAKLCFAKGSEAAKSYPVNA